MTRREKAVPAFRRAAGPALLSLLALAWLAPVNAQLPPAPPPPTLSISPAAAVSAANAAPAPSIECGACGKVESIRQTSVKDQWTPLGTGVGVGGAPVSPGGNPTGVTSYRIGPGMSNQGMVVLGAAGGAAYSKTPNSYERQRWEVTVKLDSGSSRVVMLSYEPYVREGDRVRISGSNVELLDD